MEQLGYYAMDREKNLFQFTWTYDKKFLILKDGKLTESNPSDYSIFEMGIFTADTKVESNKMSYDEFLFTQLFMAYHESKSNGFHDLAYDEIFPFILTHRERFLESEYNIDSMSEHDCIFEYLTNNPLDFTQILTH